MSFTITKRNFNQIEHLMDVFRRAEQGRQPIPDAEERGLFKNEYDVILGNIINMYIATSQLRIELSEKQVLQKSAEISALQMQINPHFLFNTLQTLNMEALSKIGRHSSVNTIIRDIPILHAQQKAPR